MQEEDMEFLRLRISEGEKLYLDGKEIPNISYYKIEHDAEDNHIATLTIRISVIVDC